MFSERLPVFMREMVDYSLRSTNESMVESGDLVGSRDFSGVLSLLILVQLINSYVIMDHFLFLEAEESYQKLPSYISHSST